MSNLTSENKVYIRSVPHVSGQNRHEHIHGSSGEKTNRTKADGAKTRFQPMPGRNGKLKTGFDMEVANPWYELDATTLNFHHSHNADQIVKKKKITKRLWLELLDGRPLNFYNDTVKHIFSDPDEKPSFLAEFSYTFNDGLTILDQEDTLQRLTYHLALANGQVAKSKDEAVPFLHRFYISEKNESDAEKATSGKRIRRAMRVLGEIEDKDDDTLILKLCVVLELTKNKLSPLKAINLINDYISKDTKEQMKNIEHFMEKAELLTSKTGVARFEAEFIARKLMYYNIISMQVGKYTWNLAPDDALRKLGVSFDELVSNMVGEDMAEAIPMMMSQLEQKEGSLT